MKETLQMHPISTGPAAAGARRIPSLRRRGLRRAGATALAAVLGLALVTVPASPASAAVIPFVTITAAVSATEGSPLAFELRVAAGAGAVDLSYATSAGTATAGADYTTVGPTLVSFTDTAFDQVLPISVTSLGDSLDEASETFTLTVTDVNTPANSVAGVGTVTDDDSPPTYDLTYAAMPVVEGGSATVTATLTPASGQAVVIPVSSGGGTATAGTDYTAIPASTDITIAAGQTTGTVVVPTTADVLDEADETFVVTGGAPATVASADTVTVTIEDNDNPPTVSIAAPGAAVAEGTSLVFPVTLSATSGLAVTVDVDTVDGTATEGQDYTVQGTTLTFAAGASGAALTQNVTVATINDTIDESATETMSVTLTAPSNATLGNATSQGIINDDADTLPGFSVANVTVDEGDGTADVTVTLTQTAAADAAFTVAAADVTAVEASSSNGTDDYDDPAASVTVDAGDTTATVSVPINDDGVYEGAETLEITVTPPAGQFDGAADESTVTINDDDTYFVTVNGGSGSEGTPKQLTATMTGTAQSNVPVNLVIAGASSGGSDAAEVSDFTPVSSAFTWTVPSATLTGATLNVTVLSLDDDTVDEATETVVVSGTGAARVTVVRGVIRIVDTDAAATVRIGNKNVGEGVGTAYVGVRLTYSGGTTSTEHGVRVRYATASGTARGGSDYVARTGSLLFTGTQVSKTIGVRIINDRRDEARYERFAVNLGTITPSRVRKTDAHGVVRITDND
jgi:hypothetical protein